jgi:hypothetical protein
MNSDGTQLLYMERRYKMRKSVIFAVLLMALIVSANAIALNVTPVLAKMEWKWQNTSGKWFNGWYNTTQFIENNQIACFPYPQHLSYVYQLQIRVATGTQPLAEQCWYYDKDGPIYNWYLAESGCIDFNNGSEDQVWWYEDEDCGDPDDPWDPDPWNYSETPYPFMAYSYFENNNWTHLWYYAEANCP